MKRDSKEIEEHLNTPERILLIQGTRALIMVRVPEGYHTAADREDLIAVLE